MTKADFMRDVKNGNIKLKLIGGKYCKKCDIEAREITEVITDRICIGYYWLDIPPAKLLEYDRKILNVYDPAIRQMNEEEREIEEKAKEERLKYRIKNPYSDEFWHMREFYKNSAAPWLNEYKRPIQGKMRVSKDRIIDNGIKGDLAFQYEVIL